MCFYRFTRADELSGLALVTASAVLPFTYLLIRDSLDERRTISFLETPPTLEVRQSDILDFVVFSEPSNIALTKPGTLCLVVIVGALTEADEALRVWASARAEAVPSLDGMRLALVGLQDVPQLEGITTDILVGRVGRPKEFIAHTGIRVTPFSLMMTGSGDVLVAGPGLPDATFIDEAKSGLAQDGSYTSIRFRKVTSEIAAGLKNIDPLTSPNTSIP